MKKHFIYYILLCEYLLSPIHNLYAMNYQQDILPSIDVQELKVLKNKVAQYADCDDHLSELLSVLTTQEQQINVYNNYVTRYHQLDNAQKNILSDKSLQDSIILSKANMDSLVQLTQIIMQSKNLDPSWQIKKYGAVIGTVSFVKNLMFPRNISSSMYAMSGAVTGLIGLQCLSKKPETVTVNLPVGATQITINDERQQKILSTIAACTLGAGTAIAASQWYTSWMHEKSSREKLTDKIEALKSSNLLRSHIFNNLQMHYSFNRMERAQHAVGNSLQNLHALSNERHRQVTSSLESIKGDLRAVQGSVNRIHDALQNVYASLGLQKQEIEKVQQALAQFQDSSKDALSDLTEKLTKDFGEVKSLVIASAILQMTIHQENRENFQAMHNNMVLVQQNRPINPFMFSMQNVLNQYQLHFPMNNGQVSFRNESQNSSHVPMEEL